MKLCRTCRYGSEYELDKPCVVYRADCPLYEKEGEEMTNEKAIEELKAIKSEYSNKAFGDSRLMRSEIEALDLAIKALEQEPQTGWNNHQIACMLADLFGDACACNYNGIDEWLPVLCDFKDTCCPNPVGVACWEQFLKYSQSRYTECGYEVRDKDALQEPKGKCLLSQKYRDWLFIQEPKTGHWIKRPLGFKCSKCLIVHSHTSIFCPSCGAKMVEPQESEDKE